MKKILIVEDEQSLREDIMEILRYEAFEVEGAENGRVGIKKAYEFLPDLIICDIMMPEVDGYDVLVKLRNNPTTANIPFIFLTAKTGRNDMRRGMVLGADDYLTKPFTQPELIATINTRLQKEANRAQEYEEQLESLRTNVTRALPHELRTPLTGIMGYARMLMLEADNLDSQQVHQMAEGIDKAATRIQQLTESYLLYAQIELLWTDPARLESLRTQTLPDTTAIIRHTATRKAQAHNRMDDLHIALMDSIELKISGEHLEKIIAELVDNAFKFSDNQTPVEIRTEQKDPYFEIHITNQGRGMTPQQIDRVGAYMQFERHLYEQSGLGLGLIIASRLCDLHQGDLTVVSHPQANTTVKVRLLPV